MKMQLNESYLYKKSMLFSISLHPVFYISNLYMKKIIFLFSFQSVLSAPHIKQKPKILRKSIQAGFKKYSQLTDRECCFKFLEILKSVYRFDQERFRCALGVSYNETIKPKRFSIKVEIVIRIKIN